MTTLHIESYGRRCVVRMSLSVPHQCWLVACVDGLGSHPMNVVDGLLQCWSLFQKIFSVAKYVLTP